MNAGKIIGAAILAISAFCFFKECRISGVHFKKYQAYKKVLPSGENHVVMFTSPNEFIYGKEYHGAIDAALFHVKGEEARHYVGSLYRTHTGWSFNKGVEAMFEGETELKRKGGNLDKSSFGELGDVSMKKFTFYPQYLVMDGDKFEKLTIDSNDIVAFTGMFDQMGKN